MQARVPAAGALLLAAEAAAAKQVWRNPRRRLHIVRLERRSTAPAYVWIIVAVAAFAFLAVITGAIIVRMKRRRAPLPAAVAHVVPASQPSGEYMPWGQQRAQPTGQYVPFSEQAPPYSGGGSAPAYNAAGYGRVSDKEDFAPLSSVPEMKSESSRITLRHDHGVV